MESSEQPVCFVAMPFGTRKNPKRLLSVDFDWIYHQAIDPAIKAAGMTPVRGDLEMNTGGIHDAMFENLILAEFVVADLTTSNPNVFYELGIRHAVRPFTTVMIAADFEALPFDVSTQKAIIYGSERLSGRIKDESLQALRIKLTDNLMHARDRSRDTEVVDSPVFNLVRDFKPASIASLKTDHFRMRAANTQVIRDRLHAAKSMKAKEGIEAIRILASELGESLDVVEAEVLIGILLAYRCHSAHEDMVEFSARLPVTLKRTLMVREQTAFACNRLGQRAEAREGLESIIREYGPSSETNGLLGRVHKDLWQDALRSNREDASVHLDHAIEAYRQGFDADQRDPFPGINLVTLLDARNAKGDAKEMKRIAPVVKYAAELKVRAENSYWDLATLLELAVLIDDRIGVAGLLSKCTVATRESWEASSTAGNLELIATRHADKADRARWIRSDVIKKLKERADDLRGQEKPQADIKE